MKTILCYGDSNTHGYRSEDQGRFPRNERYPGILQELLGADFDVKEEGLSGRTLSFDDPLFHGLNGRKLIEPVLKTHEPVDLLIVMLGTNDTKERFSATASNIARGLEFFLETAMGGRAKTAFTNETPNILVIAPPPIGAGYRDSDCAEDMGAGCDKKSERFAALFADVCERMGVAFLDAAKIPGVEMNTIDYMHFTKDAHRALAKVVAERLRALPGSLLH